VRRSAAEALGNIASEKAVEPLCSALEDEGGALFAKYHKVRDFALEALQKICKENDIRILLDGTIVPIKSQDGLTE